MQTAIITRKKMVFRIAEHVCEKIGGDTQPEDIVGVIDMVLPDTYDEAEERFQDCIAVPETHASPPRPSMLDDLREALSGDHMTIRGLVEAASEKLKPLKGFHIIRASAPQRNNPGEHVSRKPAELWLVEGDKAYRIAHCKTVPAVPLEWLEVEG